MQNYGAVTTVNLRRNRKFTRNNDTGLKKTVNGLETSFFRGGRGARRPGRKAFGRVRVAGASIAAACGLGRHMSPQAWLAPTLCCTRRSCKATLPPCPPLGGLPTTPWSGHIPPSAVAYPLVYTPLHQCTSIGQRYLCGRKGS